MDFPPAPRRSRLRRRPPRRRVIRGRLSPVAVPSFFTLMNLLSGFFSVINASQGNFSAAAWLIVLAAFFDLLDGMMARLAHADSLFGLELDSLADVVSFGLAPSFLLYQFGLKDLNHEIGVELGTILASLPVLCGAVRLARYNAHVTQGEKKDYFVGLPIPAQAGIVVTFILTFYDNAWFASLQLPQTSAILVTLVVFLSALMVSPVRFLNLPQPNRANLRKYKYRFLFFGIGLLLALFLRELGLLMAGTLYLLWCLGATLVWAARAAAAEGDPLEPDAS